MVDPSPVVVALDASRRRRPHVPPAHLKRLIACRDRLVDASLRTLTHHLDVLETSLLAHAERAPLTATRVAWLDAHALIHTRANELLAACQRTLRTQMLGETPGMNTGSADSTLMLVGDEEYERSLALEKAGTRLRYACAEALVAFDLRIGVLMGREPGSDKTNPLGPHALCEGLLGGLAACGVSENQQLLLLDQFTDLLLRALPEHYQALNRWLADEGVLPDLKHPPITPPNRATGAVASPVVQPHATSLHTDDLASVLARLAQLPASSMLAGGAPAIPEQRTGADAPARLLQLFSSQPALVASLHGMASAGGVANILHALHAHPVMQQASALDAVLVDAVAELFDVLLDDTRIPDPLRAEIARLQIPVLKGALADPAFFSDTAHPARALLDALAALAPYLAGMPAGHAVLAEVSARVSQVQTRFDGDCVLFAEAATGLQALAARLETEAEEKSRAQIADEVAALECSERKALAPIVVHEQINQFLEPHTPHAVQQFVRRDWSRLLMQHYVAHGETHETYTAPLETARKLVWSVAPKPDIESRLTLVRVLPGLIQALREGIAQLGWTVEDTQAFFAELVRLHALAVNPRPDDPASQPATPLPEPLPTTPEYASDAPVEASLPETLTLPDDEASAQARALGVGDWVEFHYEDGSCRWARLAWVGGMQTTCLFTDQDGLNRFSINLARLAEKLRCGQAVIVERRSITDSAFKRLMQVFRARLGSR